MAPSSDAPKDETDEGSGCASGAAPGAMLVLGLLLPLVARRPRRLPG